MNLTEIYLRNKMEKVFKQYIDQFLLCPLGQGAKMEATLCKTFIQVNKYLYQMYFSKNI